MRSTTTLAPSLSTLEADVEAQLAPVRGIERSQLRADWHRLESRYLPPRASSGRPTAPVIFPGYRRASFPPATHSGAPPLVHVRGAKLFRGETPFLSRLGAERPRPYARRRQARSRRCRPAASTWAAQGEGGAAAALGRVSALDHLDHQLTHDAAAASAQGAPPVDPNHGPRAELSASAEHGSQYDRRRPAAQAGGVTPPHLFALSVGLNFLNPIQAIHSRETMRTPFDRLMRPGMRRSLTKISPSSLTWRAELTVSDQRIEMAMARTTAARPARGFVVKVEQPQLGE